MYLSLTHKSTALLEKLFFSKNHNFHPNYVSTVQKKVNNPTSLYCINQAIKPK